MNDKVKKYHIRFVVGGDKAYERFIGANIWKLDDRNNLHVVYQGDTVLLLASGTWLSIERVEDK